MGGRVCLVDDPAEEVGEGHAGEVEHPADGDDFLIAGDARIGVYFEDVEDAFGAVHADVDAAVARALDGAEGLLCESG